MKAYSVPLLLFCVLNLFTSSLVRAEENNQADEKQTLRLAQILQILESAPTGKELLRGAKLRGVTERIFPDVISRTDAIITRRFDVKSKKESRERKVEIHLNFNQPNTEIVLDLAHELTHALAPMGMDPYDPKLRVEDYIRNGIEGNGGEADALMNECTVSRELQKQGADVNESRCSRYQSDLAEKPFDARKAILKDFYRVGYWMTPLKNTIVTAVFPFLSSREPILYSSTGRKPYPMALYEEFKELSKLACENTERRVASLSTRSPASVGDASVKTLQNFLLARCNPRE